MRRDGLGPRPGCPAAWSRKCHSTAPVSHLGRPASHTGAAWRATTPAPTATASPTSTTTGTATSTDAAACTARVAELAASAGGGPVLELGVGTGRLALPLATRGLEVHGIDASPAMVERLRAKPGGDRGPGDRRRHGRRSTSPDAAAVRRGARRLQHVLQPRHRGGPAPLPRPGRRRCSPRTGWFVLEAFVPDGVDGDRHRRRARPRATSRPTRWCCRSASATAPRRPITGQLVHVTEAGIRLRPWHLRYATPRPARRPRRRRRARSSALARRRAGADEPFTDAAAHVARVAVYRPR